MRLCAKSVVFGQSLIILFALSFPAPGFASCSFTDPGLVDAYIVEAGMTQEEFRSVIPPSYAHQVTEIVPENCYVEGGSDEAQTEVTVHTWNATEFLDEIRPFGLSISTDLLKNIEAYDPVSAWVIAERMKRGAGLMPTVNAHIGSYEFNHSIEAINGIDEADGDSTLMVTEIADLPAGDSQHVSWSFDFSPETGNSMTVKSFTARTSQFDQLDATSVTIYLSHHPVGEMVVVASDNYMAPVYEVESFALNSSE